MQASGFRGILAGVPDEFGATDLEHIRRLGGETRSGSESEPSGEVM